MTLDILYLVMAAVAGAVLAYALSPLSARVAAAVGAVDHPGPRKVHLTPIPRLGGVAVLLGTLGGVLVVASSWFFNELAVGYLFGVIVGLMPVLVVSLIDDVRPVSAWIKAACHLAGAVLAVSLGVRLGDEITILGGTLALGWVAWPLSVFWLVGITNAFNIVDGLDGLAAGLALIAAVTMTAVLASAGQMNSAVVPAALAGALLGFLPYNTHPARMFLGDSGAACIGFILGTLALKGGATMSAGFAAALPIFLMGLPVADTLIAIGRRLVKRVGGESVRIFDPDRNHIHHRLLALGLSQRNAVFVLYTAGALVAAVALMSIFMSNRHSALLLVALLLAGALGVQRLGYDEFAVLRQGTLLKLYKAPVLKFALFSVIADLVLVAVALYLGIGLRTDDWVLRTNGGVFAELVIWLGPLTLIVFRAMGLYQGRWSLAGLEDYLGLAFAKIIVCVTAATVGGWVMQWAPVPIIAMYGFISIVMFVGARASQRILESAHRRSSFQGSPVLVYGGGPASVAAVRYLLSLDGDGVLDPVGFLDDDKTALGRSVAGLRVLGTLDDVERVATETGATGVVVAGQLSSESAAVVQARVETASLRVYRLHHGGPGADVSAAPRIEGAVDAVEVVVALGVGKCIKCGEFGLHRSRSRNCLERMRGSLTNRRPYRCSSCKWRGWADPAQVLERSAALTDTPISSGPVDLSSLDATFSPSARKNL